MTTQAAIDPAEVSINMLQEASEHLYNAGKDGSARAVLAAAVRFAALLDERKRLLEWAETAVEDVPADDSPTDAWFAGHDLARKEVRELLGGEA